MNGKVMLAGPESIEAAIEILRKGGIVAFPTDTVYGLGAHAFLKPAVARIFQVKGRLLDQPLSLLLADTWEIDKVAEPVSPLARLLAERFWPGGLTLVLPRASQVPALVSGGSATIALRVPNHSLPRSLVRGLQAPIIGTSANLSGQPSPVTAQEVEAQLGRGADLIIDGGRCPGGVESTVVDLTADKPRVLREGAISREEIERAISMTTATGGG